MRRTFFIAAATLALFACGGDGGGTGVGDISLSMGCFINQPDGMPTLLEVEALIDGQGVANHAVTQAIDNLDAQGSVTVQGLDHTVSCRVVHQTVASENYAISGDAIAIHLPGGAQQEFNEATTEAVFGTGKGLDWTIHINP